MLQVDHIVEKAAELGYQTVALADEMSVHASVSFQNAAKKKGIKPIVGCVLRVYEDPRYRVPAKSSGEEEKSNPSYTLKVFVKTDKGMRSLLNLLTKANSADYFYYHSRVGLDDVLALEDVVVTTGDFFNVFHMENHSAIVHSLHTKFGDDLYVELVPVNTPLFDTLNARAVATADALGARTVVSYPTLYKTDEDAASLDILGCVASNTKTDAPWRSIQFVKDFGFREPNHLVERVKGANARAAKFYALAKPIYWVEGMKAIEEIVGKCDYEFKKLDVSLPKMSDAEFNTLVEKCKEGWTRRFGAPVFGYLPPKERLKDYSERLRYELSVLKRMGFSGYFLLVEDLVQWAKTNGVMVGPGRGSVGGSLVAYLIGITEVDPIRFDLLFERFINPDRIDLPDADLDFMSSKRHLVTEYLTAKYGADRVAGIANFNTLASASALRDTARIMGLEPFDYTCTKLVPKEHGIPMSLTEAAKAVPEIDAFKDKFPEVWAHATKFEGVMKSFGQHAAGVVVGGEPLVNRAVVETRGDTPVVSWDKRVVEDWGLVKMDILGLSTLDVLEIAKQYIQERHGKSVDYLRIPLNEPDVMDAFGRGDTTGIFQFESGGMKQLLKDLAERERLTFDDITAATALYRPGPMDSGLMADYVRIKQGKMEPSYEHPSMVNALKDTSSVLIYQEQAMQLARDMAGFTMTEADHLRKAMGKKDKDKMAQMRDKWVAGCKANGIDERIAVNVFDKVEAFAGYGFNKSHACAYSLISYLTMWVRVRYPAEYFAACMSIVDEEKRPGLVMDARKYGIEVLPPDVNLSLNKFTIKDDRHILAPFSAVKGISENIGSRIIEFRAREGGRFVDAEHFKRVAAEKGSKINARAVANLEKVGALAELTPGAPGPRDLSRRKDQIDLLPGLIVDAVKADRTTDLSENFLKAKIIHIVQEYKGCTACDLHAQAHPNVRAKNTVKFMVVTDCPSWQEEKSGKLLTGDAATYLTETIKAVGLNPNEGYYTTLVKAKKNDKFLSNAQINGCCGFLKREIELIKPAIIVALGTASIKYLAPGLKGSSAELAGKVLYDPALDASIVCGINPQQIGFDPSKIEVLKEIFEKVAEILS
jgi:DNA polymerase-3 subunit alpha